MTRTTGILAALTLVWFVGCADGDKASRALDAAADDAVKCAPIPCPPGRPWSPVTCRCTVADDAVKCAPIPCPSARPWSPVTCRCADAPAATCNDLQNMAAATISSAATSVVQCTTKADCQFVNYGSFDCVDCAHVVGNDNVKDAIAAQATSIKQTCDAFKAAGCKLIPSPCPPLTLDAVKCEQGQCRF